MLVAGRVPPLLHGERPSQQTLGFDFPGEPKARQEFAQPEDCRSFVLKFYVDTRPSLDSALSFLFLCLGIRIKKKKKKVKEL